MSSAVERSLAILELLAEQSEGLSVSVIAQRLNLPASAAHRLLNELSRHGYVRQVRSQGDYALTIKLAAMGLSFMGRTGVTDIAQPILDRMAQISGELIRLSVLDGRDLVWVGVAQGATGGLRYDPGREHGVVVHLASTAGGQALLSAMSDEEALMRVAEQGFDSPVETLGPNAPRTAAALLKVLKATRERGFSIAIDSYIVGMAAMAVPIRHAGGAVIGCISIAAPAVRFAEARMEELAPVLKEAADEIGAASGASHFFERTIREREAGLRGGRVAAGAGI